MFRRIRDRLFPRRAADQAPIVMTLYSRPGCHLCEEMKATLARTRFARRFRLEEVNIEEDTEAFERYERSIPVLEIGGRPAFKGRLRAADFERKFERLAGSSPTGGHGS